VTSVGRLIAAIISMALVFGAGGISSAASTKRCGRVNGGIVDTLKASCTKARAVVRYALTHAEGNAPVGPQGWGCARGPAAEVSRVALVCMRSRDNARVRLLNAKPPSAYR
jgi:hypothetical protein